jgi:endonuclease YncB( thermonuclease family)
MYRLPERLQRYILPVPESGCWLWIGSEDRSGYGTLKWEGRTTFAHRLVYEIIKGRIRRNRKLDHLCRVHCCVNPDHTEPATVTENNLRAADALACWLISQGRPVPFTHRPWYKPVFPPIFFWLVLATTFLGSSPAGAIAGNVISVLDGDTIEVLHNQRPERIRRSGIDCPEKGQACGQRAKQIVLPAFRTVSLWRGGGAVVRDDTGITVPVSGGAGGRSRHQGQGVSRTEA